MRPLFDENKLQFDIWQKEHQKLKKFEKNLKMYIINFKTTGYELTALGNIINSILNYKLKRLVSNLRLPKNKNMQKQQFQEINWARKVSKALKINFSLKTFLCSDIS